MLFRNTREAFLDHERAKSELKALMPEDAKEAIGHGVRAKRSKSGAVSFDVLDDGGRPCPDPVKLVAALASALAKAQAELVNPEKSLTATIRTGRAGEAERSFRYAPLSSGLEIVRKTLGEQEIAVIADDRHRPARRHAEFDHHCSPTPPANGSPRIGRFVPSPKLLARSAWARR